MPDDSKEPCPCTVMERAKAVCLVIAALGGLITGTIGAVVGLVNHGTVTEIKTDQSAHIQKSDESREILDVRTKKIEDKTDKTAATVKSVETIVKKEDK